MKVRTDAREAQQFVGSEIQIISDREVIGYSRIRGGWNNGRAYTVYFYTETDKPFVNTATWKGDKITNEKFQYDSHQKTGALLRFNSSEEVVQLKVGISFLSSLKARQNAHSDIPHWSFETAHQQLLTQWEDLLQRIEISPRTPEAQKRMFYTGLYHTMIMPVDRSGENPLWADNEPYYDDFYAIWDTYRTSSPLITLMDPKRETDIVRSLINIYKRDGYMPDARSGNCNGRTQGGSNAEIVIADAFVKGLEGIDYELGLQAMLKDATVDPGDRHEAEGRGALTHYLQLGYIPLRHSSCRKPHRGILLLRLCHCLSCQRAGKRRSLSALSGSNPETGRTSGVTIMNMPVPKVLSCPAMKKGNWLDEITFGKSNIQKPTFTYTPVTFEGPWYTPWWNMFFYEASSWEYSLSIPHDVPGLIEKCGGAEKFEARLDIFFDRGFFNVNNEPSFLSPLSLPLVGKALPQQ